MQILSAKVITGRGPDKVLLKTNKKCPFVKAYMPEQPSLDVEFHATADTGAQYVRDTFNMEPEVIRLK